MRKIMNLVAQLLRIVLWKTWNLKRKLRKLKHRLRSAFLNAKWELPVLQVHKDILQKLAFSSVQSSRCPNDFSDSEREEPESESDRHEGERSTLQKREEELEHEEEGEEDEQNEEDTTEIKDSEEWRRKQRIREQVEVQKPISSYGEETKRYYDAKR
ncbi:probable ATP-dependent RNA helicase ddx56 isoform X3 [Macadamia integrifolia]|uniref:probable ATP-dependent RNA helicase ddx56 isoform X3 n=1 Tax=Macadamia integrifolia TaxID=60698 RepID=UPI001C52EDE7|nr:probable ATP-dependent RNA helicase ddx56 isoform X3 [Macadamia integrifolia]